MDGAVVEAVLDVLQERARQRQHGMQAPTPSEERRCYQDVFAASLAKSDDPGQTAAVLCEAGVAIAVKVGLLEEASNEPTKRFHMDVPRQ